MQGVSILLLLFTKKLSKVAVMVLLPAKKAGMMSCFGIVDIDASFLSKLAFAATFICDASQS
jgi:hypothetical protein